MLSKNAEQIEMFAGGVLKVLEANHTRFGLMTPAIRLLVRQFGFDVTEEATTDALEYLAGKGLVQETPKILAKANRAWKITDAGRQYVDERNL